MVFNKEFIQILYHTIGKYPSPHFLTILNYDLYNTHITLFDFSIFDLQDNKQEIT
jgi:hypothetical protein